MEGDSPRWGDPVHGDSRGFDFGGKCSAIYRWHIIKLNARCLDNVINQFYLKGFNSNIFIFAYKCFFECFQKMAKPLFLMEFLF